MRGWARLKERRQLIPPCGSEEVQGFSALILKEVKRLVEVDADQRLRGGTECLWNLLALPVARPLIARTWLEYMPRKCRQKSTIANSSFAIGLLKSGH
jgi:hypothetical protein